MTLDQAVALGIGLEMVGRFGKGDARFAGQKFGHPAAKLGMRIDARADGRAANRKFEQRLQCHGCPAHRALQLPGQPANLLPSAQRRGVGQMRPADLEDICHWAAFSASESPTFAKAGINPVWIATAAAT